MTRWEYSRFSVGSLRGGRVDYENFSTWTGPDGQRQEMPGQEIVILTSLGLDGWEVVAMESAGSGTRYLLKRALDER